MTETDVQRDIIHYLQYLGIYVVRVNSGDVFRKYKDKSGGWRTHRIKGAKEGTPDLLCCIDGRFIGMEIKKDEQEVEKWKKYYEGYVDRGARSGPYRRAFMQNEAIREIEASGGRSFIISSIGDVNRIFEIIGYKIPTRV